jgi:hypothetical protein
MDEMVFAGINPSPLSALTQTQFLAHAEYKYSGLYGATRVPNPELVALGVKFSTVEEFMETELKPRFVQ